MADPEVVQPSLDVLHAAVDAATKTYVFDELYLYNIRWHVMSEELKPKDVVVAEWLNFRRGSSNTRASLFEPPDFKKESTYDGCYQYFWNLKTRTLKVRLYEGDMVYGEPKDTRCEFVFAVTDDHVYTASKVKTALMDRLRSNAKAMYLDEEQRKEDAAIDVIYNSFFTQPVQATKEQQA